MGLLRILIPSWRFFDRLGRVPELLYRVKSKGEWSPWMICIQKPERKFYHLFANPAGNLYLAYYSLVERLIDDSQSSKNFEEEISFQQIKRLVHNTALKNHKDQTSHFEFKVSVSTTEVFKTQGYEL